MKGKIIKVLSTIMFLVVFLVSCGGSESTSEEKKDGKLNVAILLNGTLGDKAFFDSAANGGKMIEEKLGANVKIVEMTEDETKWLPTLTDFSEDEDTDIIIVGTWQMKEKLEQLAPNYPDKKYIIFDTSVNYKEFDLPNVYSIEYKQNEGSFLAGAVAALETKTGLVGFVGGMEIQVVNDFLLGYIQGVKSINKDIKMNISYIGDFKDSAKGKELALAQINQGSDIIFQVASTAGLGVIDAVTEKNKLSIGVDSDQAVAFLDKDSEKANHILTSALKRIDISLFRAIKLAKEDKLPWGEREVLGIQEECIGIAKNDIFNNLASKETIEKVNKLEKEILEGKIKVDTAYGKTTEQIAEIKNTVKP
ncbi:BMP family lipoprotein [Oceanivirga salmonicida]|uniref:BMP family lipoprotein n=1 Tax=Oceanivirga salmonicida TaxID=1769291 RepID=UPI000834D9F7|nr:BMP family ABC transporter substrate-binding protein [Oceanivirga salmonicida]